MQSVLDLCRALLRLPEGASTVADGIDLLHLFVISVTMLVSAYVFSLTAYFTVRYRRRVDGELTVRVTGSRRHEATLVAVIGATFLFWWVIGFRQYLVMSAAPTDADVVYVTAKQWMWKFSYADGRETNDVLTVPVARPTRLVMTSRDVIHSFYVPAFRIKADVVPGRTTSTWFEAKTPGKYPLYCAEYCGVSHSFMLGWVVVLSPEDYVAYVRGEPPSPTSELVDRGRAVAERRACVACHTLDGQPHIGPTWSRLYGAERPLRDGRHVVADEAYLTRSMMEPGADIVADFQNVMPTYQGSLDPIETAALVDLIKSLRDGPILTAGVTLPTLIAMPTGDAGAR